MEVDVFYILLVLKAVFCFIEAKESGDNCRDAGFSSNLLCGSCDELKEFKLHKIYDDCKRCCQAGKEEISGKYERGADPVLVLHDDHQTAKEVLSIDKWDTNTIEEFLMEKVAS